MASTAPNQSGGGTAPSPAPSRSPRPTAVPVANRLAQLVYIVFGVIDALILLRMLLLGGGASGNWFTNLIFNASAPFVAIFGNILPTYATNGHLIHTTDVLALIVYGLVGLIAGRLILAVAGNTSAGA